MNPRNTPLYAVTLVLFTSILLSGCTFFSEPEGPPPSMVYSCPCPDGTNGTSATPNCLGACPINSTSTFKEFKSTNPEQCKVMRFTCDDAEMFSDESGCGCVREHTNAAVTQCPADYNPVCGWSDSKIKCFAYPCAQTESNLCNAATNPNVAYTTPGECPKVGSKPSSCGNSVCDNGEADVCPSCYNSTPPCLAPCTAGTCPQDCSKSGSGISNTKTLATDCPVERTQACTREYLPVCGQKADGGSATYSNKCAACADNIVLSYYDGKCSSESSASSGIA